MNISVDMWLELFETGQTCPDCDFCQDCLWWILQFCLIMFPKDKYSMFHIRADDIIIFDYGNMSICKLCVSMSQSSKMHAVKTWIPTESKLQLKKLHPQSGSSLSQQYNCHARTREAKHPRALFTFCPHPDTYIWGLSSCRMCFCQWYSLKLSALLLKLQHASPNVVIWLFYIFWSF